MGCLAGTCVIGNTTSRIEASSAQNGFEPVGAYDGNRFSEAASHCWKGASNATSWQWQINFRQTQQIGAALLVLADHSFVFTNAPQHYEWSWSSDGTTWQPLKETEVTNEQRLYRLQRFNKPVEARSLRLTIHKVYGSYPTIREVEFLPASDTQLEFPNWILAVNTTHDPRLPGHGQEFIPLARQCDGWKDVPAQQVWLSTMDESFVAIEPTPLCSFLSGNFKDWCEVDRETWRGVQQVLKGRNLPIWASCGGAQGLAILEETGVDRPWDCPHCRDPKSPKLPIYGHIGHTGQKPRGDYSECIFERGAFEVTQVMRDPVFVGLPTNFAVMQSHCGQIEWAPKGWSLVASGGPMSKTRNQCLRVQNRYIYAAQFHIEMAGTPETSRMIMANFLKHAKSWGGYNPRGTDVPFPSPH